LVQQGEDPIALLKSINEDPWFYSKLKPIKAMLKPINVDPWLYSKEKLIEAIPCLAETHEGRPLKVLGRAKSP
jgi:hypothetical protein